MVHVCILLDRPDRPGGPRIGLMGVLIGCDKLALAHAAYLRRQGHRVWIDDPAAPGTVLEGRSLLDYRTAADRPARVRPVVERPASVPAPADTSLAEAAQWPVAPPGIHVAGVPVEHLQRCARCGGLLACWWPGVDARVPATPYPIGALVERGRGWQATTLRWDAATCQPAAGQARRSA